LISSKVLKSSAVSDANRNRMTELVKTVSKKEVPTHSKRIIFEICADDLSDEDVEIPYVALKWRD
jgi:ubiquitin-activating enzyme E1